MLPLLVASQIRNQLNGTTREPDGESIVLSWIRHGIALSCHGGLNGLFDSLVGRIGIHRFRIVRFNSESGNDTNELRGTRANGVEDEERFSIARQRGELYFFGNLLVGPDRDLAITYICLEGPGHMFDGLLVCTIYDINLIEASLNTAYELCGAKHI